MTWHELAERGIAVRGEIPAVYTNLSELLDFTRANLDTFWRGIAEQIEKVGLGVLGGDDNGVAFVRLGPARLHHLLTTKELTSKSGAGRYTRDVLDDRWSVIAREALRIRENPATSRLYDDPVQRGRDAYELLTWIIADSTSERAV